MTEREGCAILKAVFTDAGYAIAENVTVYEEGITVELDGWDEKARVGYEFITLEAHDDLEFTDETLASLELRTMAGELYVFLIDEHDALTEDALREAAGSFLKELSERGVHP